MMQERWFSNNAVLIGTGFASTSMAGFLLTREFDASHGKQWGHGSKFDQCVPRYA
jgi:hypothetical protein